VDPWSFRGGSVVGTDVKSPGQAHDGGTNEEDTMNHFDTIALAEQHRESLLHDAQLVRSVPRSRSGRRPSVRSLLSRVRHS
jgi:hypothetical protein